MSHHVPHRCCSACGKYFPPSELTRGADLRQALVQMIRKDIPDFGDDSLICRADLRHYREIYLQNLLREETGELGQLEAQVATALAGNELLTPKAFDNEEEEPMGFGARMADRVAALGGSWGFILSFLALLVFWMILNSLILFRPFDPYPYILLNLMLSCVAAIQAPIIMMSQGRQEDKDRKRAQNDYLVNLKAELELRQLHEKIDYLLAHQWQRLLEIQQIQIDLLQDMRR